MEELLEDCKHYLAPGRSAEHPLLPVEENYPVIIPNDGQEGRNEAKSLG